MKRLTGGLAAAAVLLAGCGSTAAPAAQTVTRTATVAGPTGTVTASATVTSSVPTRIIITQVSLVPVTDQITMFKTVTTAAPTVVRSAVRTVEMTVTESAAAAPGAGASPGGSSLANGDYIVGSDIAVGTYKCNSPSDTIYWETTSKAGDIVDNDLGSIARVVSNAYAVKLSGCDSDWTLKG